ncbi:hypothetical protein NOF04DRAFT_1281784 [Fusarium oxysporum II5]|nr:hypothetical protein NOF04DRAFT_1281784 [Fusarium oxysporum II5]
MQCGIILNLVLLFQVIFWLPLVNLIKQQTFLSTKAPLFLAKVERLGRRHFAKAAQGVTAYITPFWLRNFDEAVDFEEGGSLELRVQPEVFVLEGGKKAPPFCEMMT